MMTEFLQKEFNSGEKLLNTENIDLYIVAPDHERSATGTP